MSSHVLDQRAWASQLVGLVTAALVALATTVALWEFVVMRWAGVAVLVVLLAPIGNRLWAALRISLIERFMEPQDGTWEYQRLITARLPEDAPEFGTGQIDSALLDLLVQPETGTYTIQSDHVRNEHTVKIYTNSADLLDGAMATLITLFENAGRRSGPKHADLR